MAGLIQQKMNPSAADEQMEQEPVEGTGPDGSAQHEGMEGDAPEANDSSPSGEEGGEPGEDNPAYQAAMQFAMEALYGNKAAKGVAEALKAAQDPLEGLANTAYEMVSIIDEKTNGEVPDELLVLLATNVLEEVAEIGEAAGLDITPATVASALKMMILRFLGEQGVDTTQLEQAMGQINPDEFNKLAMQERGGEQTEEEVPV